MVLMRAVMGDFIVVWNGWSGGNKSRCWGLYGHYGVARAVVVIRIWGLLWARSWEMWGRTRSVVILLGLEVRWWMPVIVFSGRPSSTSAHSAGVECEGGRCSWLCSFCMSVRPLAQTAGPDVKSGQAECTLRAPEMQTKDDVRRILINNRRR